LIQKIKRKYQNENITPGGDDETVIKLILEEYSKNKVYFKRLISLDPKEESALQIERDLGRTFPKNVFF